MKALFKKLPVLLLAGAISVSCGKDSNSSGGKGSSNDGISGLPDNTYTQNQAYSSIDQVRSAFENKALGDGLNNGTEIYHMGPYFNSNYGSGGINFEAGFCLQLFNWSAGDCEGQNNGQETLLLDQLDNGVYKKVTSVSASAVNFKQPSGVSNQSGFWQYIYDTAQAETYNRSSQDYIEMLGLNYQAGNIIDSKVSPATITMSNGQQVQGQILEIVTGYNNYGQQTIEDVKRYVVSTNLPTMANPIAVINGANPVVQTYNGVSAMVNGYLAYLGNSNQQGSVQAVQQISINKMHVVQGYYGSELQAVQNIVIGF